MATIEQIKDWIGNDVVGSDEDKIGKLDQVYLDRQTGDPSFAAVKTGMFGSKVSLIPIAEAQLHDDHVHVPFDKAKVKDAPNIDADAELSEDEEQKLYAYYGQDYSSYDGPDHESFGGNGHADHDHDERGDVGQDTSGPNTDDAMTRSEEELRVGKRSEQTGKARLRKYIVTENVTTTVPVSREEVRIEREPITDANRDAANAGGDLTEEEHEVTLHAERPVVEKEVVAKERVRLDKDTVTEDVQVDEEVRKEQIEADGDGIDSPR